MDMHLLRESPGGFHADNVQAVSDAFAVLRDVLRPQATEHPLFRAGRVALQLLADGAAARRLGSADDGCSCNNDKHTVLLNANVEHGSQVYAALSRVQAEAPCAMYTPALRQTDLHRAEVAPALAAPRQSS